ncbi:hypothetical protein [Clostridium beijerinckii]|uniref:Uncharacterized protein n=1 Tax=Clostridium beijerinckii TaxID=1520 RepID=A0AAX0B0K2_CLOBE|nr:hypothetical protein [Clostridium beijerinckii]NRT88877.1 hypothetical protein [Clostridium beijerinckii]NYC74332.1 hypothetical protein [Clostridium beijerinckii]
MVKIQNNYIKTKVRGNFGDIEVYNSQVNKNVHSQLVDVIKNNSESIDLENGMSDIQINNTIPIMRFMLINLSNVETAEYWNSVSDIDLEDMLNLADGDFKQAVNSLLDMLLEITQDIRIQEIRKLNILKNKLNEFVEVFNFNSDVDNLLDKFGLDRELLIKIQNGDKEAIEKFQKVLFEKNKKTRKPRTKKTK